MVSIELSDAERQVLVAGVIEWGGPARCTEDLAMAMGFAGVADLFEQSDRLIEAVRTGANLDLWDWARLLVLTEIVFVSDVFGSGSDWSITTGISDSETIEVLRGLQRKLTALGAGRTQYPGTGRG